MKNRLFLPAFLSLALVMGVLLPILTPDAEAGAPEEVLIRYNGETINMDSPPLMIDATTYVPLYDFCKEMGPATLLRESDIEPFAETVVASGIVIRAVEGECYITANERYLYAGSLCQNVEGKIYVPIRTIAKAFGFSVFWTQWAKRAVLYHPTGIIESGRTFYNENDVYWMSRIINAEAGGECMDGKIAVGNVVMNRIDSPLCPNTVYDVIFDNRFGVQFTPAYSGAVYCSPNPESIIAAKLALEGASVIGTSLYFNASSSWSWASRNRPYVTTIGNHCFFG